MIKKRISVNFFKDILEIWKNKERFSFVFYWSKVGTVAVTIYKDLDLNEFKKGKSIYKWNVSFDKVNEQGIILSERSLLYQSDTSTKGELLEEIKEQMLEMWFKENKKENNIIFNSTKNKLNLGELEEDKKIEIIENKNIPQSDLIYQYYWYWKHFYFLKEDLNKLKKIKKKLYTTAAYSGYSQQGQKIKVKNLDLYIPSKKILLKNYTWEIKIFDDKNELGFSPLELLKDLTKDIEKKIYN